MSPDAEFDGRLKAAFAFDAPPARDYGFEVRVMQDVARRRLLMSLLMLVPPALAAAAVLWAVSPQFEPLAAAAFQSLQPAVATVTVALFLAAIAWRLLKPLRS